MARTSFIDSLKGIAILGVVLLHFNFAFKAPAYIVSKFSMLGTWCPQLFFVISAYLTWKSLDQTHISWSNFYKKRFLRIAPVYYVALVVAVLIPVVTVKKFSVWDYIAHLLFINGFSPVWNNDIIGGEWYIANLAIFYMLCPVLKQYIHNLRSNCIFLILTTALSAISLIVFNQISFFAPPPYEGYRLMFCFLHQWPVLLCGTSLYYLCRESHVPWKTILMLSLGCMMIVGAFVCFHLNDRYMSNSCVAGFCCSVLFLICYKIKNVFLSPLFAPLVSLGKYSLSIYLLHMTLLKCMVLFCMPRTFTEWGLFYAGLVGASYILGKYLESGIYFVLRRVQTGK